MGYEDLRTRHSSDVDILCPRIGCAEIQAQSISASASALSTLLWTCQRSGTDWGTCYTRHCFRPTSQLGATGSVHLVGQGQCAPRGSWTVCTLWVKDSVHLVGQCAPRGSWTVCTLWVMVSVHLVGQGQCAPRGSRTVCTLWVKDSVHLVGQGQCAPGGSWTVCTLWVMDSGLCAVCSLWAMDTVQFVGHGYYAVCGWWAVCSWCVMGTVLSACHGQCAVSVWRTVVDGQCSGRTRHAQWILSRAHCSYCCRPVRWRRLTAGKNNTVFGLVSRAAPPPVLCGQWSVHIMRYDGEVVWATIYITIIGCNSGYTFLVAEWIIITISIAPYSAALVQSTLQPNGKYTSWFIT